MIDPLQPYTQTLLPLSRYAEIMQIPLTHFWQMNGPKAPLGKGCDVVWDYDSREALAWGISQAEHLIAEELGFWPAPKFITNEKHNLGLNGVRGDWWNAELETRWGYVEGFGTETLTLVQADATVLHQNLDSDPLDREETATIGTALYSNLTACSDILDVAIFFRTSDGAEDAADPRWEIKPIKVDIDGTTMQITAESSLFLRPDLQRLTEADCRYSDDTDAWKYNFGTTNLVSRVDVYCRTINKSTPVTLRWDGRCGCSVGVCEHETQSACAYNTDLKYGFFTARPATWTGSKHLEATPTYWDPPESVLVNYRAGYPLDSRTGRMDSRLERAIVKLTNVLLSEPPCGYCDIAQRRWQEDRKRVDPLTLEAANLPWAMYQQGALDAWKMIRHLIRGRGGKLGR